MDYIEVFKDGDLCEIVGVHCNFALSEIVIMGNEFESFDHIEIGIKEDGIHFLKPIFHPPEYCNGGLTNGSWYDFKYLSYEKHKDT